MLEDFKRVLARVQSDYGFYIDCQVRPEVALAGYDLSAEERSALRGDGLAAALNGIRVSGVRITIAGTHDWVNAAGTDPDVTVKKLVAHRGEEITGAVTAVREARSEHERSEAAVRLMELLG